MAHAVELVVEGVPSRRLGICLRELWRYRSIVGAFTVRNLRLKYKQSILGVGWALLQPLAFVAVFTLTLGNFADVPGGGSSYAAFSLSALVPWSFVAGGLALGATAVVNDAALVRKVYFPREASVLGAILSAGVDFGVGLVAFVALGPILGATVSAWWLLAPLLILPLALLVTGVTLVFAALNAYYRDVRYALPFLQQLWLFASPVAYPLSIIPDRWRAVIVTCNPVAGILDSFRHTLALGNAPDWAYLGIGCAGSLVVAFVGYWMFKRLEPRFAEVV